MTQTMTQLLEHAKAEILTRGWCQGMSYHVATGRVCMYGALALAENAEMFLRHGMPVTSKSVNQALNLLSALIGNVPVPTWNDAPERTLQDVLGAFDAAIAISAAHEAKEMELACP